MPSAERRGGRAAGGGQLGTYGISMVRDVLQLLGLLSKEVTDLGQYDL